MSVKIWSFDYLGFKSRLLATPRSQTCQSTAWAWQRDQMATSLCIWESCKFINWLQWLFWWQAGDVRRDPIWQLPIQWEARHEGPWNYRSWKGGTSLREIPNGQSELRQPRYATRSRFVSPSVFCKRCTLGLAETPATFNCSRSSYKEYMFRAHSTFCILCWS